MVGIDAIPDEVVLMVFKSLHLRDRKNVRQTCKRWLQLSYDQNLVKNDVLVVEFDDFDNYCSPNIRNMRNMRMYVRSWEEEPQLQSPIFFQQLSPTVQYMQLIFHRYWRNALTAVLQHLRNVQELEIREENIGLPYVFNYDRGPALPSIPAYNLERVRFYGLKCRYLINSVLNNGPAINSVAIDGMINCTRNFTMRKFMKNHCSQLKELVLDDCVSTEDLTVMLQLLNSQLTTLLFDQTFRIFNDDPFPLGLFQKFVNLKKVSLPPFKYKPNDFGYFFAEVNGLTHLSIKCDDMTGDDLAAVGTLPNLTCLLVHTYSIETDNLKLMLGTTIRPNLKCLRIYAYLEEDAIDAIAYFLPNIEILDIPIGDLTHKSFNAFNLYNEKLQVLSCKIKNKSLFKNRQYSMKNLTCLEIDCELEGNILQHIRAILKFLGSSKVSIFSLLPAVRLERHLRLQTYWPVELEQFFRDHPALQCITTSSLYFQVKFLEESVCKCLAVTRDLQVKNVLLHAPWDGFCRLSEVSKF